MKHWWARVASNSHEYGNWIPTGETNKDDAIFYLYRVRGFNGHVVEWLQL